MMTTTTDNRTRFRHDATPQNGTAVMVDRYNLETHRTERIRATIVGIAAPGSLHCDVVFSVEAKGEVFAALASNCFPCEINA